MAKRSSTSTGLRSTRFDSAVKLGARVAVRASLLAVALGLGAASHAAAQSAAAPPHDFGRAHVYLRELSRFAPELARQLETDLQSAPTSDARRKVLRQYGDQLSKNYGKILRGDIPPEAVAPNFKDQYDAGTFILMELSIEESGSKEARYTTLSNRQKFEDEVIRDAGFKDYHELYKYLHAQYPSDYGDAFLKELKKLKDDGKPGAYAKKIDLLEKLLDVFRKPSPPPGESILNDLNPYLPSAQCLESDAKLKEAATKAIKKLHAYKEAVAKAMASNGGQYGARFSFLVQSENVFERHARRLAALLKQLKGGRKTDCAVRYAIHSGMLGIGSKVQRLENDIPVLNRKGGTKTGQKMLEREVADAKNFNAKRFF
jgi:hypothetical protein